MWRNTAYPAYPDTSISPSLINHTPITNPKHFTDHFKIQSLKSSSAWSNHLNLNSSFLTSFLYIPLNIRSYLARFVRPNHLKLLHHSKFVVVNFSPTHPIHFYHFFISPSIHNITGVRNYFQMYSVPILGSFHCACSSYLHQQPLQNTCFFGVHWKVFVINLMKIACLAIH